MHKNWLRFGLRPKLHYWRTYHAFPYPVAGFQGSYFWGKGGERRGRKGEREKSGRKEDGRGVGEGREGDRKETCRYTAGHQATTISASSARLACVSVMVQTVHIILIVDLWSRCWVRVCCVTCTSCLNTLRSWKRTTSFGFRFSSPVTRLTSSWTTRCFPLSRWLSVYTSWIL